MKKLMLALIASTLTVPSASAQVRVKGYVTKSGTYVAPHYRSSPNSSTLDNYSTKGNYNPYTGNIGTKDPYSTKPSSPSNVTFGSKPSSSACTYFCSSNDEGDDD